MTMRFSASQSIELNVKEEPIPIQHYLRQPQRLTTALVDSSRTTQLSDDCFRLKMRPLKFMMLSVQPTVDMRIWAEADGTIHLESTNCEIRGVEYINQRFNLHLVGILKVQNRGEKTCLTGQADLEVKVDIPPPLRITPNSILEAAGNGLLRSVLMTIKQRLSHQLLLDYRRWVSAQMEQGRAQRAAGLSPNSPTVY